MTSPARWTDDTPWPDSLGGLPPMPILAAYPYLKPGFVRRLASLGREVEVLIDCGAFTAFKTGRNVDLDEYCRFLEGLPFKPWRYFALDVIGDPIATRRNHEIMLKRGFHPMPVFTRGATLADLDRLFEQTDCVGLGGVAGADKSAYAWARQVMAHAGERPTHILGFTDSDWLKFLRPYSCDSSSWAGGSRYGTLMIYMGQGTMKTAAVERYAVRPPVPAIAARIRRYGFEPGALRTRDNRSGMRAPLQRIATASWCEMSIDLRMRFGTRLFLVAQGQEQIDLMLEGRATVAKARGIRLPQRTADAVG